MAIDPKSAATVYALGEYEFFACSYKSIDGGTSWQRMPIPLADYDQCEDAISCDFRRSAALSGIQQAQSERPTTGGILRPAARTRKRSHPPVGAGHGASTARGVCPPRKDYVVGGHQHRPAEVGGSVSR